MFFLCVHSTILVEGQFLSKSSTVQRCPVHLNWVIDLECNHHAQYLLATVCVLVYISLKSGLIFLGFEVAHWKWICKTPFFSLKDFIPNLQYLLAMLCVLIYIFLKSGLMFLGSAVARAHIENMEGTFSPLKVGFIPNLLLSCSECSDVIYITCL